MMYPRYSICCSDIGYFDLFDSISYNEYCIYFLNAYSPALKYLVHLGTNGGRYSGLEETKYLGDWPNIWPDKNMAWSGIETGTKDQNNMIRHLTT